MLLRFRPACLLVANEVIAWGPLALLHFRDGHTCFWTLPFFSISKTAQDFAHKIGKTGTRQSSEWYWADKVDCGKT